MNEGPVLFTTVRLVPASGAKLSERFTVPPVAVKPLTVSGTVDAELKVASSAWRVAAKV